MAVRSITFIKWRHCHYHLSSPRVRHFLIHDFRILKGTRLRCLRLTQDRPHSACVPVTFSDDFAVHSANRLKQRREWADDNFELLNCINNRYVINALSWHSTRYKGNLTTCWTQYSAVKPSGSGYKAPCIHNLDNRKPHASVTPQPL